MRVQWYKLTAPAPFIGPNLFSSNVWETGEQQEYPVGADVPGEIGLERKWNSCTPPDGVVPDVPSAEVSSWWREGVPEQYWLTGGPISDCGGVIKIPMVSGIEVGGQVGLNIGLPMVSGIEIGGDVVESESESE